MLTHFCRKCQPPPSDNSFGSVELLFFYASRLCISSYGMFSFSRPFAYPRLSTSTRRFPFLVFLTCFGLVLIFITFPLRKGDNLARLTSTKNSWTISQERSAASLSEYNSEWFRFVLFLFEEVMSVVYSSLTMCSTTHYGIQLELGMYRGHMRWGYTTSILELEFGFRAVANIKFSARLLSTRLTFNHCLLAPKR